MSNVKQLKAELHKANKAAWEASDRYQNEFEARKDAAILQIRAALEPLKQAEIDAKKAAAEVQARHDAAVVAEAQANPKDSPHPFGVTLCEWKLRKFTRDDFRLTGLKGVIEVWSDGSESPANMCGWRLPRPGSYVIRILKKNGKPSARFVSSNWDITHNWLPEGETRKAER